MLVFVTGGNGFIGSRVVRLLCERGDRVRCLLRPASRTRRIDDLPVERLTGTLADTAVLARGLADADACIHLASVSAWSEIAADHVEATVVGGTRRLLEAAGPKLRLLHVSSAAAINGATRPTLFDETSPFTLGGTGLRYAVAKHDAELLVLAQARRGLDAVVVNPAETYGPDDDDWVTAGAIRDALRGWPALAVRGGTSVAHVDDVADGILRALDRGRAGERYILGGDNLSIAALVRLALRAAGRKTPVLVLPRFAVAAVAEGCALFGLPAPLPRELIGYATRYWFVRSDKARRELGYRSRPAARTLADVVAWIMAQQTPDTSPQPPRARPQNHPMAVG